MVQAKLAKLHPIENKHKEYLSLLESTKDPQLKEINVVTGDGGPVVDDDNSNLDVEDTLPSHLPPQNSSKQNSLSSVERIPICAEKTLVHLYIHFKFECKRSIGTNPVIEDTDVIQTMLKTLKQELGNERFGQKVLESVDQISSMVRNNHKATEICSKVKSVLKEIRPLDLDLMLDYIEKNSQSGQKISNKDIIILLGGSG